MILLDTCAVIDLFRSNGSLVALLKKHPSLYAVSEITCFELYVGALSLNKKSELALLQSFLSDVTILRGVDFMEAANLYVRLRKDGIEIPKNDCIIAAAALRIDSCMLVTKDLKHFSRVPSLQIITY